MSKHTYGFPAATDKIEAVASALAQAQADGFITSPDAASTEILQTDAHREAAEFVVIVRSSGPQLGP